MLEIILIVLGIAFIFAASIFDIKTREVPNWLAYNLIIIALATRLFYSIIFKNYSIIFYGLIGVLSMFILGSLMYYTKQWGGGDTKLLAGIGATFSFSLKFIIILLILTLITGALYGIAWSIYLAIKHKQKFINELRRNNKKLTYIRNISLFLLLFSILSYFIFPFKIKILTISTSILIIIYLYLLILIKAVEKSCMYKIIPVSKLTEGDWIAKKVFINKKLIVSQKDKGITKKQLSLLKKSKIKKIMIKEGIPFVPVFLISSILALFLQGILSSL